MTESKGYISSIETMGLVDGPGIRIVFFLQGCPLRCLFCHNPETWSKNGGIEMEANASLKRLVEKAKKEQVPSDIIKRAIDKVRGKIKLEHVLIDAMPLDLDIDSTSIIKGDAKSISIAAASVIAKVTRDNMMYELDKKYPMYGFASHKGYPTKKHIEAINKYGLIDGYRKTYSPVKDIIEKVI